MRIHLKSKVTTRAGRAKTAKNDISFGLSSKKDLHETLTEEIEQRQQKQGRPHTDVHIGGFEDLQTKAKSKGDNDARHNDAHAFDKKA